MSIIDKILVLSLESGMPLGSWSQAQSKLHIGLADDLRMASLLFAMYQVRAMTTLNSSDSTFEHVETIEQGRVTMCFAATTMTATSSSVLVSMVTTGLPRRVIAQCTRKLTQMVQQLPQVNNKALRSVYSSLCPYVLTCLLDRLNSHGSGHAQRQDSNAHYQILDKLLYMHMPHSSFASQSADPAPTIHQQAAASPTPPIEAAATQLTETEKGSWWCCRSRKKVAVVASSYPPPLHPEPSSPQPTNSAPSSSSIANTRSILLTAEKRSNDKDHVLQWLLHRHHHHHLHHHHHRHHHEHHLLNGGLCSSAHVYALNAHGEMSRIGVAAEPPQPTDQRLPSLSAPATPSRLELKVESLEGDGILDDDGGIQAALLPSPVAGAQSASLLSPLVVAIMTSSFSLVFSSRLHENMQLDGSVIGKVLKRGMHLHDWIEGLARQSRDAQQLSALLPNPNEVSVKVLDTKDY